MPEAPEPKALLDLDWQVNRIDVGRDEARRFLEELPRRAREASIRERASRVRCPVHGKPVRLLPAFGPSGELHFALDACCEDLERHLVGQLDYRPMIPEAPPYQN